MMRKEEKKEVLVSILSGKRVVVRVHLLSESIREGLGWMSYREK
jgi:hypothetical protein